LLFGSLVQLESSRLLFPFIRLSLRPLFRLLLQCLCTQFRFQCISERLLARLHFKGDELLKQLVVLLEKISSDAYWHLAHSSFSFLFLALPSWSLLHSSDEIFEKQAFDVGVVDGQDLVSGSNQTLFLCLAIRSKAVNKKSLCALAFVVVANVNTKSAVAAYRDEEVDIYCWSFSQLEKRQLLTASASSWPWRENAFATLHAWQSIVFASIRDHERHK